MNAGHTRGSYQAKTGLKNDLILLVIIHWMYTLDD